MFIGDDIDNQRMFRYLGHYIQDDSKYKRVVDLIDKKISKWTELISGSVLSGVMKSWILDNVVITMVSWL